MPKTPETKYQVGQWVCASRNGSLVYSVIRYITTTNFFPFEREYITEHGTFRESEIREAR